MSATATLWLLVVASGLYHGLNPGMGWPLALSAGLWERRGSAVFAALVPLAAGHLAAMTLVLLPFAALAVVMDWSREIRVGAGLLVVAFGLWRLVDRRHPRFLARIPPARIALWSFLVALAHGAGLMLVPVVLGLCTADPQAGPAAAAAGNVAAALGVAVLHSLVMIAAGGALAYAVYRWLGLKALSRTWFDLDAVWGASLVVSGAFGVWSGWH
ncbi:hypothetical protein [Prosthecomicrobium sp. N25]|uniref:hypothetical protein n=1 Tax=Prosthecomicrobium sp. N25 TaxID=3129254 RepID=UPI0030788830